MLEADYSTWNTIVETIWRTSITPESSLHHTTHTDDNRIQSRSRSNSDPTDYSSGPTRYMLDTCACFDEPDFYFREYLGEVIKRILRRQENASHDDITDLLNDTSHIDYFNPADEDDDEDDETTMTKMTTIITLMTLNHICKSEYNHDLHTNASGSFAQ